MRRSRWMWRTSARSSPTDVTKKGSSRCCCTRASTCAGKKAVTREPSSWEIRPLQGAGPIHLGMKRNEVRAAVGAPVSAFRKSVESAAPADAFDSIGVHVHYGAAGEAEAVEF